MDAMSLAQYAPLPASYLAHLRTKRVRVEIPSRRQLTATGLEAVKIAVAEAERTLFVEFIRERDRLDAEIADLRVTTKIVRELTNSAASTIGAWYRRGLLRTHGHGMPDRANAVALILMRRMQSEALREWLPPGLDDHAWWCYEVTDDGRTIPTPVTAPLHKLRITSWSGAAQLPGAGWIRLQRGGAVHVEIAIRAAIAQAQDVYPQIIHTASSEPIP